MSAISTFELLYKPQLPRDVTSRFPELEPLARTVLQGYFLTVANLEDKGVTLSLTFVTRTPSLDVRGVLARLDVQDQNGPLGLELTNSTPAAGQPAPVEGELTKTKYEFFLNPQDTGLVLVQPNVLDQTIRRTANFEIRGYVELALSSKNMQQTGRVLISAEHRATFFAGNDRSALGEIAYPLPLAGGSALLELQRS